MGFFSRNEEKKKHAHYCAVFFFSLVSVGLLIGALNVGWYQDTTTFSVISDSVTNSTTTFNWAGATTVTTTSSSTSTSQQTWANINSPHLYAIYQSAQSFSTIAVIISGATAAGAILVWLCSCCDKGVRDVVKVLVGIVSLAAIVFCILAWAVFLGTPKAMSEDYSNQHDGAACPANPCGSFRGSSTTSNALYTEVETWGPFTGFWLVIGATASALIVFLEIVREAKC